MNKTVCNGLLALGLVFGLVACSKSDPETVIYDAKQYLAAKDYSAALVELKSGALKNPNNAEVRRLLGEANFSLGNFDAAEKEFNKALQLGIEPKQVIPELVRVNYYTFSFLAAEEFASEYYSLTTSPNQRVDLFRFLSALKLGQSEEGVKIPDGLVGDHRQIAQAYQLLVDDDLQKAREALNKTSDESVEPAEKAWLSASLAEREQNYPEAVRYFSILLTKMPKLYAAKFQYINALISTKAYDQAEKSVDEILAINKETPYANLLKANLYFQQEQYSRALPFAEKAVQNGIDITQSNLIAGVSAYQSKQLEKAYLYLKKASPGLSADSTANKILAQTALLLGYSEEAVEVLNRLPNQQEIDSTLFTSAGIKLAEEGDLETAKRMLAKANKSGTNTSLNELRLGLLKIATNDKKGLADIEAVIDKDPALTQAWMLLTDVYLKSGDVDKALELAERWTKIEPANGLTLKATIFNRQKQLKKANRALQEALEISPKHIGANQLLLVNLIQNRRFDEAESQIYSILEWAPGDLRALRLLVELKRLQGEPEAAEPVLLQQVEQNQGLPPKLILAIYYIGMKQHDKAIQLLENNRESLEVDGGVLLGDAYTRARKFEQAKSVYKDFREQNPQQLTLWLRGIGVEELSGNIPEAAKLVEQALQRFPNAQNLMLLKLNYLVAQAKTAEAKRHLKDIDNSTTDTPIMLRLKGQLDLIDGNYEKAAKYLHRFYQASPSFPAALLLSKAWQRIGRYEEAVSMLVKEFDSLPNKNSARHTLAEFYAFNKDHARAIAEYKRILMLDGKDYAAMNNLANAYIQAQDYAQAVSWAEKANAIAKDIPQLWDTLGWAYFKAGRKEDAYSHTKRAFEADANNVEIQLHWAEILISLDFKKEAKAVLRQVNTTKQDSQATLTKLRSML